MDNFEQTIERAIQAKGLTAPRLTPAIIDAVIAKETFHVFPGTTLTVCVLTLYNGFTVTGESAAASPENFNEEIGRRIARDNARAKIWALEGYMLKTRLHERATGRVPVLCGPPAGSLFDELQKELAEALDLVTILATDMPMSDDMAQRVGQWASRSRGLVGNG